MEKIFYKRWTSVLAIVAVLVIVVLLCLLLTFLAQKSSFEQHVAKLNALIEQAEVDSENQQKVIEYKQTEQYIIDWAIENNLVSEDDYLFVPVN